MSSATITIEGFLAGPAELKFSQAGQPRATFSIPHNEEKRENGEYVKTGHVDWYRCTLFGSLAEAMVDRLAKSAFVTVTGALTVREYEHNGEKRTSLDVIVRQISDPRPPKGTSSGGYQRPTTEQTSRAADDPWATGGGSGQSSAGGGFPGYPEEPPFGA